MTKYDTQYLSATTSGYRGFNQETKLTISNQILWLSIVWRYQNFMWMLSKVAIAICESHNESPENYLYLLLSNTWLAYW